MIFNKIILSWTTLKKSFEEHTDTIVHLRYIDINSPVLKKLLSRSMIYLSTSVVISWKTDLHWFIGIFLNMSLFKKQPSDILR